MYYRGNRRVRRFLLVMVHLVMIGMLFQITAPDHWHAGFDGVLGVAGSSTHIHEAHCHGNASGCADAGGAGATIGDVTNQYRLPNAPLIDHGRAALGSPTPDQVALQAPLRPPQAA